LGVKLPHQFDLLVLKQLAPNPQLVKRQVGDVALRQRRWRGSGRPVLVVGSVELLDLGGLGGRLELDGRA
jgi:hypothetical protein